MCGRLFEVTPDKEMVWEYILTDDAQRVYRYPYDYRGAFQSLGTQVETAVTPPDEFRVFA